MEWFIHNWCVIVSLILLLLGILWGTWLGLSIVALGASIGIIKLNPLVGIILTISSVVITVFYAALLKLQYKLLEDE